jgi:hypothetical protein
MAANTAEQEEEREQKMMNVGVVCKRLFLNLEEVHRSFASYAKTLAELLSNRPLN